MNHSFRLFTLQCLVFILCILHPAVVISKETLNIATIDIPPWGITPDRGIYYDLANRIATEAGFTYHNSFAPLERTLRMLSTGEIDICILFAHERVDQYAQREVSLLDLEIVLVAQKDVHLSSIDDLNGKVIGFIRGAAFTDDIDMILNAKIYRLNSYQQGVKMLFASRLDALAGERNSFMRAFKKADAGANIDPDNYLPLKKRTVWLYVSNHLPQQIKEKINLSATRIKSSDYIDQLIRTYNP